MGGEPPESATWFCTYLQEASDDFRVQKNLLKGLRYTVFGLGNSIYEDHYNTVSICKVFGKHLGLHITKLKNYLINKIICCHLNGKN